MLLLGLALEGLAQAPIELELAGLCRRYKIDPERAWELKYGRRLPEERRAWLLRVMAEAQAALDAEMFADRPRDMPMELSSFQAEVNTLVMRWERDIERGVKQTSEEYGV